MASRHGVISEYEASKEDWTSYTERLQQHFAANEIVSEDKQRAILISVCGAETYQLLRSLLAPVKPAEKTFVQLVELMKNHLQLVIDRDKIFCRDGILPGLVHKRT